jgi:hypothetical protein
MYWHIERSTDGRAVQTERRRRITCARLSMDFIHAKIKAVLIDSISSDMQ